MPAELSIAQIEELIQKLPDDGEMGEWRKSIKLFKDDKRARLKNNPNYLCFFCDQNQLTALAVDWFMKCGWTLHILVSKSEPKIPDRAILGPMLFAEPVRWVYHTTPAINLPSITSQGILRGIDAKVNTTQRIDSGFYIHVSLTEKEASDWAKNDGLLSKYHHGEFAILKVDMSGIEDSVCRDPFSTTGHLLTVTSIEPSRIIGETIIE